MTETFIEKWLTNRNGTLATYIQDGETEDRDLVKGREALSESLGLWMEYAVLKNDQTQFHKAYELLVTYFLEEDGFVHWKLNEAGQSEVFTNALVDDLRICWALLEAEKKWKNERYGNTAAQISQYVVEQNTYNKYLIDYYMRDYKEPSKTITLSYIEPLALNRLQQQQLLDEELYAKMLELLKNAPVDNAFFPKAYSVEEKTYFYDTSINMIDQSLVALYRARAGYETDRFTSFVKQQLAAHKVVYGLYDRKSVTPISAYESTAVYGWLILYCLEVNEQQLALQIYKRMKFFQSTSGKFAGGYAIYENDAHIFDTIVPLLAEQSLLNHQLVP